MAFLVAGSPVETGYGRVIHSPLTFSSLLLMFFAGCFSTQCLLLPSTIPLSLISRALFFSTLMTP
jgi:hypothetical protein